REVFDEREQPIEVQLHISENRGAAWRVYAAVAPDEKRFHFRAPRDGEYWFMVRTKYPMGVLRPIAPPGPELIVVVDTTPPQLDLAASLGAGGEILVRWSADDDNPRSDGLKVEYRTGDESGPWRSVAVDPLPTADAGAGPSGELTFMPEAAGPVSVRAEIQDLSGNRAVSQTLVDTAAGQTLVDPAAGRYAAETIASPPPDQRPPDQQAPDQHPADQQAPDQHRPAASPPAIATRWPAEPSDDSPLDPAEEIAPPRMSDSFPGRTDPFESLLPEPVTTYPRTDGAPATAPVLGPAGPSSDPSGPQRGNVPAGDPAADASPDESQPPPDADHVEADAFQGEMLPPGVRPRWVNSRRFELEYEIDAVGPSGIAKVELWGTRDGGVSWTALGVDEDGRSPMSVSVEGEGMYGFRMVVETGTGLRTAVPRAGDLPDVWVAVDLTRPTARLIAAEQGTGEQVGELAILWEAEDQLLGDRPISLWFSESPHGPWTAIAAGLENTGRYSWRLDHRVGDRIYLRLEVRDEAGNVRVVDTADVVSIDAVRPRGHIRNVRPLGDAARRSKLIYNLFR
ncbi:MAG: hypothetical protein WD278_19720, partial [Pirellulales bacterium]